MMLKAISPSAAAVFVLYLIPNDCASESIVAWVALLIHAYILLKQ